MEYQNRPVEWITTETEKIAKDKENNNVRNAALLAGGVGAIGVGSHIKPVELNTTKHTVKTLLGVAGALEIGPGVVGAVHDELARRNAASVLHDPQAKQFATRAMKVSRNAHLMQAGIGAATLAAGRKINPVQLNKKKLVAHLGLITGGAAAAAAGAHGLMKEKKASKEDKKEKVPSGWNRLARGAIGHVALPAIGATAILTGAGLSVAADNVRNPYLKGALYGTGSLLALGGAATAGPGPLLNDSYQAYKYIQEH